MHHSASRVATSLVAMRALPQVVGTAALTILPAVIYASRRLGRVSSNAHSRRRSSASVEADRIARLAHGSSPTKPHVAGSPRDRELAEWIRDRWREFGLEEVEIVEHEVLLPWPRRSHASR